MFVLPAFPMFYEIHPKLMIKSNGFPVPPGQSGMRCVIHYASGASICIEKYRQL